MPNALPPLLTKFQITQEMSTNPIGKGTKTLGINMDETMEKEIERQANSMSISKSKYCKIILQKWIDSGKSLMLKESL